ncbi:MAG: SAM-dependent DNA methyltransferase [Bacteroidales bacterium]|nr:SAM-dependent DNA methyltransferase [Bacteroidales bacterium]
MSDIREIEKTLWAAADKLRSNMDAAEYKHVVLGLIFLKYISDAFAELHEKLVEGKGEFAGANPEDADEYLAYNVFYVPEKARWTFLQSNAKQPNIGVLIDQAMDSIEKINDNLKGVLPKNYADPDLDKQRLGELLDLIGNIGFGGEGHQGKDLLGQVYEYFLGMFADAEGKNGGQFYTPQSIVKVLVSMLEPYKGRIYDGCCGSGGMFVQSEKFIESHQGKIGDLSIYGQESNPTTVKLAKMNLAIRGIDANIQFGDTFTNDLHPDLKADYVIANPPFNISDWKGEQLRDDKRWKYGVPQVGNANYAWLQHFIHKLSPTGTAGIVLANGSMNSNTGNEGEIRKAMIDAGVIDCMVALPAQLFYNTMIPACLWFLAKNRTGNGSSLPFRNRENEILFIDARKLGTMINRRNKELSDSDINQITDTYHLWRNVGGQYNDIAGFCKAATIDEVVQNNYVLMPGRYVGTEEEVEDLIPFAEKMQSLTATLAEQFSKGEQLQKTIRENLKGIGYEF